MSNFKNRFLQGIALIIFDRRSVPVALFVIMILAYGLLIHQLGFYWDDWPWIWLFNFNGPKGMLEIDQGFRPLSGVILYIGGLVAGKSPLLWQVLNLIFRWFSALALWWALTKIFPKDLEKTVWIAFVFLVYPGFGQQYISVNSSRHILPFGFFFLSLGFMIWAVQTEKRYWIYTCLALFFSISSALSTDYFLGLELIRPVLLWIVIPKGTKTGWNRMKQVFKYWMPFLLVFGLVVAWRYIISPTANYEVELVEEFSKQPAATLVSSSAQLLEHAFASVVITWKKIAELPIGTDIRFRRAILYWFLIGITFLLSLFYLYRFKHDKPERTIWMDLLGLGMVSLLVAALPFLAAQIPMRLSFPSDRTTLPMAFGASLLFISLVEMLARHRIVKIGIVSAAVALAVGAHFINAVKYEQDWDVQASLVRQLTLRIPGLKPDSILIYQYTTALQEFHSTSNSLTSLLNLVYSHGIKEMRIPYYFMDLRINSELVFDALKNYQTIYKRYGRFDFESPSNNLLAVQFMPPWCLQVLEPKYARLYPHLPDELASLVGSSNLNLIELNPELPAEPLTEIFGKQETPGWCEYFQLAEIARQKKDWQKVAQIGDEAFQDSYYPEQPSEMLTFILAYGYQENWQRAVELTLQTLRRDKNTVPLLCQAWSELTQNTPDSERQKEALAQVQAKLSCLLDADSNR